MLWQLNWELEGNLCRAFLLPCSSSSWLEWCSICCTQCHDPHCNIHWKSSWCSFVVTCYCSSCCTLAVHILDTHCLEMERWVWGRQHNLEEILNGKKMLSSQDNLSVHLEQGPVTAAPSERMRSPWAMSLVATRPLPAPGIDVTL